MERAAPCKTGCLGSSSGRSDKGRGRANATGSKPLTQETGNPPAAFVPPGTASGGENRCARRDGRRGNRKRRGCKIVPRAVSSMAAASCFRRLKSGPVVRGRPRKTGTARADESGLFGRVQRRENGAIDSVIGSVGNRKTKRSFSVVKLSVYATSNQGRTTHETLCRIGRIDGRDFGMRRR